MGTVLAVREFVVSPLFGVGVLNSQKFCRNFYWRILANSESNLLYFWKAHHCQVFIEQEFHFQIQFWCAWISFRILYEFDFFDVLHNFSILCLKFLVNSHHLILVAIVDSLLSFGCLDLLIESNLLHSFISFPLFFDLLSYPSLLLVFKIVTWTEPFLLG